MLCHLVSLLHRQTDVVAVLVSPGFQLLLLRDLRFDIQLNFSFVFGRQQTQIGDGRLKLTIIIATDNRGKQKSDYLLLF